MLSLLSLGFTLALLLANVWGMTLAVGMIWRCRWVALVAAPWVFTTVFFAVECHVGLGRLQALGALGTLVSVALILLSAGTGVPGWLGERGRALLSEWRGEFAPRRIAGCGAVFFAAFAYGLAWRYVYPDLHTWIEKIPDLAYVAGYAAGDRLPAPDVWLAPFRSVHYYSFQHYAAALAGRLLGVAPGVAYNLGFSLLVGWIGAGFGAVLVRLSQSVWIRVVVWVALMGGGSGVSLLAPLVLKAGLPWEATFLFGKVTMDKPPLGTALEAYASGFKRMNLPVEPLAYSIYLGDYHAPLASYALMGLAAVAALRWQETRRRRDAVLVGASLTWTVLANLWSLPLQGAAVVLWALWHWRQSRHLLPTLVAGAGGVWALAWGYLSAFTAETARQGVRFAWVLPGEHTPPLFFLIALGPTLLLVLAALPARDARARWLAAAALLFLAVSEAVFVDDSYTDLDNRFNTTLKWWPWISAATLLLAGPLALGSPGRLGTRALAWLACLAPCAYLGFLVENWGWGDRQSVGYLEGHRFITKEAPARLLLQRLEREPRGLAIEDPRDSGSEGLASLPLYAGHRLWLGWDGYEGLWRGFPEDVARRRRTLVDFYEGTLTGSAEWLLSEGVDYVLFYRVTDTVARWKTLDQRIGRAYVWCEIMVWEDRVIGFWKRRAPVEPRLLR